MDTTSAWNARSFPVAGERWEILVPRPDLIAIRMADRPRWMSRATARAWARELRDVAAAIEQVANRPEDD